MNSNNSHTLVSLPEWTPQQVATATLVVVGVALAFFLAFRFQLVLFSLFEAIVFSTAINPSVDWLQRRGLSRTLGVALVYLILLGLIIGSLFIVVPLVADQATTMAYTITTYYNDLHQALLQSPSILIERLATRLPGGIPIPQAGATSTAQPLDEFAQALSFANVVFRGFFTTIAVVLLTSYWTLERDRVTLNFIRLVPVDRRDSIRALLDETGQRVGAYLRGLGVLCFAVGAMATIAYIIIGLPYALLLGVLAGILEAVPLVGPILGAVSPILVALAIDPSKVIWIILATLIIQLSENNLLVPRVMDQAVGINPVVSLLAFAAFSSIFGLAGALLAIPLAVVIQLLINHWIIEPSAISTPPPVGRDTVSILRLQAQELIQDVRKQVREKDGIVDQASDQIEDAIEAVVNDLDSILAQAETQKEEAKP